MLYKDSIRNKLISFLTITAVILSWPFNAFALNKDYSSSDIKKAAQSIIDWKKADIGIDEKDDFFSPEFVLTAGSPLTDWYAIALGRMDDAGNYNSYSYLSVLENYVEEKYKTKQLLDATKATEWHRISLVILALGGDPSQVGDKRIDLIADGIYNRGLVTPIDKQGINGLIWGLIALDSIRYEIPENANTTRESIIEKLLSKQNPNGSFSLIGNSPDIDITAMALTALSPYYNGDNARIKNCIKKGIDFLSSQQNNKGGFSDDNGSEGISQTIIALCSLNIDPVNDLRFIKNNNNLLDALMSYKSNDGGFIHTLRDNKSNSISGEQALLALISLYRFQNGMSAIYDFRKETSYTENSAESSLVFDENDINRFKALPNKLTTKNYSEVLYLSDKLNHAENKNDYSDVLDALKKKKATIESIRQKIERINQQILNKLYPFDNITTDDSDVVESIYNDVTTLDSYDREQVLGYEDLIKARTKIHTSQRSIVAKIITVIVFIAFAVILILRIRQRRLKMKDNLMTDKDNYDW